MSRGIDWDEWMGVEMRAIRFSPDLDAVTQEDDPLSQVPIIVIYQDEDTLACVQPVCDRLLQRFGRDAFRVSLWPLASLGSRKTLAQMSNEAKGSDIIMLALHGDQPLPGSIKKWIETWHARRAGETGAVGALFLTGGENISGGIPADRELHALLLSCGLDYFSDIVLQPEGRPARGGLNIAERAHEMTTTLAGIMNLTPLSGFSHWGINE